MAAAAAGDPFADGHARRWRALVTVGVLLLGVVVVLGLLTGLQRRLIYFPGQAVPPLPAWVETVETTTADGLTLRGWQSTPHPPVASMDG